MTIGDSESFEISHALDCLSLMYKVPYNSDGKVCKRSIGSSISCNIWVIVSPPNLELLTNKHSFMRRIIFGFAIRSTVDYVEFLQHCRVLRSQIVPDGKRAKRRV